MHLNIRELAALQKLSMEFLEFLWKKFEDPNVQSVFRQTAILYIASYLVHAHCISTEYVSAVFRSLENASRYFSTVAASCRGRRRCSRGGKNSSWMK